MHVSGSEENFKLFTALVLKLLMKNIGNLLVRLFVISLLTRARRGSEPIVHVFVCPVPVLNRDVVTKKEMSND